MAPIIRPFEMKDAQGIADIYNHYIENTPATFDMEPISLASHPEKFSAWGKTYPCFVALEGNRLIGYASSAPYRLRAAYARSVEVSVYLAPDVTAKGIGTALYQALFAELKDFHRLLAGITQPNPASVALHKKLGFTAVGTMTEVGYKFDKYWDVVWYEKPN